MTPARKEPDLGTYSGRLAKRLRTLRDKAGFTAEEVVQRMAKRGVVVSLSSYYGWETGRRKVDIDAVPALAKALRLANCRDLWPGK